MNRLKKRMSEKPTGLLNIYFTAGYPRLEDTGKIIKALDRMGVDLVEIGMPYSDPLADGPTIQESGAVALKNGMTLPLLFEQLTEVRPHTEMPMILMGYFNQVMQFGVERFLQNCQRSGIDALILPDLPLAVYESEYQQLFADYGLESVFLITPQTEESRIRKIDELSTGFIYVVSSYAITGAKKGISPAQIDYFERIAALNLNNPRLIGFGISDRETFQTACAHANGAIIGSAFIRALARHDSIEAAVDEFVGGLKASSLHV
ncbi:MAG: tryptophan synthase subunit alpha [Bacteroidota bacterium]